MKRKILYILVSIMSACSTVPKTLEQKGVERLAQLPPESRKKINTSLSQYFSSDNAPEIDDYLSKIAKRLIMTDSDAASDVHISLISSNLGVRIQSPLWIIPPDRGYLDEKLLKNLDYENEIAAALAFDWERAQDLAFEKRFILELDEKNSDFRKIYVFSESEDLKAIESTVDRLYRAGYDPRGLVSYLGKRTDLGDRVPLLQDKARRTLAFYSPLLNPIVRTEEFYKMKRKLQQL